MAKDPAFLFYHQDFLVGTSFLSMEERGQYITILCFMADKGSLTPDQIGKIIGKGMSIELSRKFKRDENGDWYNQRLLDEVNKRKYFCESRRLSRMSNIRKTYDTHTENEDVNENEDKIKDKGFIKPNVLEIKKYCIERKNKVNPDNFFDFYESKGWMIGRNKMKDWKAAIRTWEKNKTTNEIFKRPASIVVQEYRVLKMTKDQMKSKLFDNGYSEQEIGNALEYYDKPLVIK